MFQVTSPLANLLVMPQYNSTVTGQYTIDGLPATGDKSPWVYTNGPRDILTVLFYVVVWLTAHAIIQEYIVDKLQRRLHLSKTKTSKFTESAHLLLFSAY